MKRRVIRKIAARRIAHLDLGSEEQKEAADGQDPARAQRRIKGQGR